MFYTLFSYVFEIQCVFHTSSPSQFEATLPVLIGHTANTLNSTALQTFHDK